jgi:hypothetical protein
VINSTSSKKRNNVKAERALHILSPEIGSRSVNEVMCTDEEFAGYFNSGQYKDGSGVKYRLASGLLEGHPGYKDIHVAFTGRVILTDGSIYAIFQKINNS